MEGIKAFLSQTLASPPPNILLLVLRKILRAYFNQKGLYMKSRVYLVSLAMLMGLLGKVFAAAEVSERSWASPEDMRLLDNQTYYDANYIPRLSDANLVREQKVVTLELSNAKRNFDKEKEKEKEKRQKPPYSAAYRAAGIKFMQAHARDTAVYLELADKRIRDLQKSRP